MSQIWTEQKEENVNKTNLNKSLRGCYTVIQKLIYRLDKNTELFSNITLFINKITLKL